MIWSWTTVIPLLPLFVINLFMILGLPVFALHVRRHGLPRDERIAARRSVLGLFLQHYLLWLLRPLERLLVAARVAPNALTGLSVLLSILAAWMLAIGHFGRGGWLFALTGIVDICDGRVARATNRVSEGGAFADSVADRVAEAAIFTGLAWYYRGSWVLLLVMTALGASLLVSYTRARGEGLGVRGVDIGAMQRPERILFLGLGLVFSPIVTLLLPPAVPGLAARADMTSAAFRWPAVIGIGLVAFASLGTAMRRFLMVFRSLEERQARAAAAGPPEPSTTPPTKSE